MVSYSIPLTAAASCAVTPRPVKRSTRPPSGTSSGDLASGAEGALVGTGARRQRRACDERDRRRLAPAVLDAPGELELGVAEAPPRRAVPGERRARGRAAFGAKGVAPEGRAIAVGHLHQPVPGVDEAVERAAAAAVSGKPQADVDVRAQPASEAQVQRGRLAVDQEASILRRFARHVLRPGEGVRPERRHAQLAAAGAERPRRQRRQREARLREELAVADLGRSARNPRGRGKRIVPGRDRGRQEEESGERVLQDGSTTRKTARLGVGDHHERHELRDAERPVSKGLDSHR